MFCLGLQVCTKFIDLGIYLTLQYNKVVSQGLVNFAPHGAYLVIFIISLMVFSVHLHNSSIFSALIAS